MSLEPFIPLFLSLIVLSAIFSGTETAFFSLNLLRKKRLARLPGGHQVTEQLKNPRKLLITILVGNTLVNVSLASFSSLFFESLFGTTGFFLSIILTTLFLLVLSEITPKIIALNLQESFALSAARAIKIVSLVFQPLVSLLMVLNQRVLALLKIPSDADDSAFTREELKSFILRGTVDTTIKFQEKQIIDRILQFSDLAIDTIKVPRIKMICIPITAGLADILELMKTTGYTRIPIYRDSPDAIIGLIIAKDLLPCALGRRTFKGLSPLIRPVPFVPEMKRAALLFREMIKQRQHLAITIDEFGGVSGLITMEDLLEKIVGEIYDEWDSFENPIQLLDSGQIRIQADLPIPDFNRYFNRALDDGSSLTIGGYIFNLIGHLPAAEESIVHQHMTFTIESRSRTHISTILVSTGTLNEEV